MTNSVDPAAIELSAATAATIGDVAGRFMLDGATYVRGAELGFAGMDFYFVGRGGVLGPTTGPVVAAAMAFLGPDAAAAGWDAGRRVMPVEDAARHFIACGHEWARSHLDATTAAAVAAELLPPARRVVAEADDAACPLFTAWRDHPWPDPDDAPATVLHALHLLRELRGGLHAGAVRAVGLRAHEAVVLRAGYGMAPLLGWTEPHPDRDAGDLRARWERAEALTDEAMGRCLGVLSEAERPALRSGLERLAAALDG